MLVAGEAGLGLAQRGVDLVDRQQVLLNQQIVDRGEGHQQALELKVGDVQCLAPLVWWPCCDPTAL